MNSSFNQLRRNIILTKVKCLVWQAQNTLTNVFDLVFFFFLLRIRLKGDKHQFPVIRQRNPQSNLRRLASPGAIYLMLPMACHAAPLKSPPTIVLCVAKVMRHANNVANVLWRLSWFISVILIRYKLYCLSSRRLISCDKLLLLKCRSIFQLDKQIETENRLLFIFIVLSMDCFYYNIFAMILSVRNLYL